MSGNGSRSIGPNGMETILDVGADAIAPCAEVTRTTNFNVTTGTTVQWESELLDNDNIFDPGSNTRLTCRTAGKYLVWANISGYTASASTSWTAWLKLNGTTVLCEVPGGMLLTTGYYSGHSPIVVVSLAVGDYIECIVYNNTASNYLSAAGFGGGGRANTFGMARLGPSLVVSSSGGGNAKVGERRDMGRAEQPRLSGSVSVDYAGHHS